MAYYCKTIVKVNITLSPECFFTIDQFVFYICISVNLSCIPVLLYFINIYNIHYMT